MTCTVSPFDRIRTNLMNQPTTGEKLYNGFVDCTAKTIQKDGVASLWRGFIPMYVLWWMSDIDTSSLCGGMIVTDLLTWPILFFIAGPVSLLKLPYNCWQLSSSTRLVDSRASKDVYPFGRLSQRFTMDSALSRLPFSWFCDHMRIDAHGEKKYSTCRLIPLHE